MFCLFFFFKLKPKIIWRIYQILKSIKVQSGLLSFLYCLKEAPANQMWMNPHLKVVPDINILEVMDHLTPLNQFFTSDSGPSSIFCLLSLTTGGGSSDCGATSGTSGGFSSSLLLSSCRKRNRKCEQTQPPRADLMCSSVVSTDLLSALSQLSLSALSGSSSGFLLFGLPPVLFIRGLGHALKPCFQLSSIRARCKWRETVSEMRAMVISDPVVQGTYRPQRVVSSHRQRSGHPCLRNQLHSTQELQDYS